MIIQTIAIDSRLPSMHLQDSGYQQPGHHDYISEFCFSNHTVYLLLYELFEVGTIIPMTRVPITPRELTIIFADRVWMKKSDEIAIISHIKEIEYNFIFRDMPLLERYFKIKAPRYLLFIRKLYSLSELCTYKPADSNKNGVVGKPGTNAPNTPIARDIVPKEIIIAFSIFVRYLSLSMNFPTI